MMTIFKNTGWAGNIWMYAVKCLLLICFPMCSYAQLIAVSTTNPFPEKVLTGSSITATFAVKNITSKLTLSVINESSFPASSGLSIASSTCTNPIAPGQSCTIVIQLNAPSTPRTISAALKLKVKNSLTCIETPFSIRITQYIAYVANVPYISGDSDIISICPLTNGGASLGTCIAHSDPTFNFPVDIILNKNATIAYVANSNGGNPGSHTISICPVNTDGSLNACQAVDAPGTDYAGLTLNATNTLLYYSDFNDAVVNACTVMVH